MSSVKLNIDAVGIDLGTTNSAIAYLDAAGRPVTLDNAEGDKTTPSVILLEDGLVIVGKEAIKAMSTEMAAVAQCVKRGLGTRVFHKKLGGRRYPPEVLQAWILRKLTRDAREQIGHFNHVVITVPAYFDEVRRKATQDAGYIAGLEVLDIINEPTAAAIAYGLSRESDQEETILVYDLGGGTFDVTIMQVGQGECLALATDGDVLLGGQDWDQRLIDYVAEQFLNQFGHDPRDDPNTVGQLWRECEDAKRTLSSRHKATVSCVHRGEALRVEIRRDAFEQMTRDLLERTAFTTRQTLQASGLEWSDIDHVLLVGGSTRMPAVGAMLRELTGKDPARSISPDEAVAHGAALHAGELLRSRSGLPAQFHVRNVNSHSLGLVAMDAKTKLARTAVLIPRNTPLPADAERVFKTKKANQRSILVQVVEGESASPDDCSPIGRCVVRDLPPDLPANTQIKVRFHYAANGRLTVSVGVSGSDRQLEHTFTRDNSLTQEQLDSWREYLLQQEASDV